MKRLRRAVLIVLCCGLLWTAYIQWLIHTAEGNSHNSREVGIVLGAALWNDAPSPALRERLDLAITQYREGMFEKIIVSGGLDLNGATITEAEGMAAYLIKQGIPGDDILLEPEATSTYQNLLFSKRIMEEHNWSSAYMITHTYHGARAMDIAKALDYEQPAVILTDSQVMWMPWHKTRETLAFTKWKLAKWFRLLD